LFSSTPEQEEQDDQDNDDDDDDERNRERDGFHEGSFWLAGLIRLLPAPALAKRARHWSPDIMGPCPS
jgi:hypothetical protein